MIIKQTIHPFLSVPEVTAWETIDEVVKWGSACDRQVLDRDHEMAVIIIPANQEHKTQIVKYYESV